MHVLRHTPRWKEGARMGDPGQARLRKTVDPDGGRSQGPNSQGVLPMRVLVTGSEGTLGRALISELEERGHEVWGCDLMHSGRREKYVRADIADPLQLERAFERSSPHLVYHLAAEFGRLNGEEYTSQLWRTNCQGTKHVLDACGTWGVRMVFASSSEVYGEEPFDTPDLEEVLLDRNVPMLSNEYAISKYTNELQVRNHIRRFGTRVAVLRFFNAYGPGETYHPYRSVVALFVHAALSGKKWQVFEGYHRTFMWVGDFIPTLANASTAEEIWDGRAINIGGDDYRSVEELSEIVIASTGCDPALAELVGSDRHNVVDKKPNIERAQCLLGHKPGTKLEVGVPKTVKWMRAWKQLKS